MIDRDGIQQAIDERTPKLTHEPGCPENTLSMREWWEARGVSYEAVEEWCITEAREDVAPGGVVQMAVSTIGVVGGVGACLATVYELALMGGVALAEKLAADNRDRTA